MEGEEENFLHYKKLLIFGTEGSGKTTLTDILSDNVFKEKSPSEKSNNHI